MIEQFRDAFDRVIQANPTDVSFFKNGSLIVETIRLSHEAASVPSNKTTPVGLGTSFSMFVDLYYDTQVTENTVLIENGNGWKVNAVDSIRAMGEVYGKRASLTLVTLSTAKALSSFKIGSVVGVIVGLNITVTLPIGTPVTALTPTIVQNGQMISPIGAQDFTNPVEYTVTAQNLTTQIYTVTVVLA
jgi:hypothetical protein